MNYKDVWLGACFGASAETEIIAYFKNGTNAKYSFSTFRLLMSDPTTETICDGETGEVIFVR